MKKDGYNVIGVMSGTSLDGVDMAHVRFHTENGKWDFEILETQTVPYKEEMVRALQTAIDLPPSELSKVNLDYTLFLSDTICRFIKRNRITKLDAVCSHGHTITHRPDIGITLQIGNTEEIKTHIKTTVICDFRVQDVVLGGQGAPLVPIGDRLLFSDYKYCLNLGGFSNISFEEDGKRIAFDISPVNTVLNHYAGKIGQKYDEGGSLASAGAIDRNLLQRLNDIPYYQMRHPKSLGIEFLAGIIPIIDSFELPIENILRTFCEHIAMQVARAIPEKSGKMLITGGGAYNMFLVEQIQAHVPKIEIIVPESKIIEYKEALIFALLGVLKLRNEVNVLSSVTGAMYDHCSGVVYT